MFMKKVFTLILLVSILVSCSDWKYSNGVKRQKRTYVYSNPKSITESEISTENEKAVSVIDEEITTKNQKLESVESAVESQPEATENNENQIILVNTKKLENDEDSLKPVNQSVVDEALEAEKKGKYSQNFGIAGLILTITFIFGFVGLVLSIIGLTNGIKSLKAKYNTPEGLKMARTGVILSSIVVGLNAIAVIIVVTAIILLLTL
jgi:TolA-binding protein